jgi:hypothetical protein
MRPFWKDVSLSAVVAGFVAVLVGFTSSIAIIFAAAQAVGADTAQTASWIWALGLGTGLTSLGLSLWTRQPVLTAWSTPGAALIAASQGITLPEAVGAFIVCAGLILLVSVTGWFEKLMDRIPMAIAAALLAGVLTRFALDATLAAHSQPLLIVGMAVAFLAGRRWWPRYAVPGVLLAGVVLAAAQGLLHLGGVAWGLATPVWVTPQFSLHAMVGLGLPLFVVTMASQNLPGVAAQRAAGYSMAVSPTVGTTGLASLVLAPSAASPSIWRPSPPPSAWAARPTSSPSGATPPRPPPACSTSRWAWPGRRGRPAGGLPEGTGHRHRRPGPAGHHRRRSGQCAAAGAPPRRRAADLCGHAVGSVDRRHRVGLLGRAGRRPGPAGQPAPALSPRRQRGTDQ